MAFGLFEAAISSEAEVGLARQAAADKMAAAVYDVREQLGPSLFTSSSIEEFRDKVAMMKNDQSIYKIVGAHLPPVTGTVRRIVGRNSELEREFKALLATGIHTASDEEDPYGAGPVGPPTVTSTYPQPQPAGMHVQACYPGCQDNEAHAKKFHKDKEARRHRADFGMDAVDGLGTAGESAGQGLSPSSMAWGGDNGPGPASTSGTSSTADGIAPVPSMNSTSTPGTQTDTAPKVPSFNSLARRRSAEFDGEMDNDSTFKPSDKDLVPKDNWDGYLNKVDQNGNKVQDRNFISSMAFAVYQDWAKLSGLHPMKLATLDRYATNLDDMSYLRFARAIQAWEFSHQPKTPSGQSKSKLKDVTAATYPQPEEDPEQDNLEHERERREERMQSGHYYAGHPENGYGPGDYPGNGPASAWNDHPEEYKSQAEIDAQPKPHHDDGHPGFDSDAMYSGGPGGYPHRARRDPMPHYIAWCKKNNLKRISAVNVDYYSRGNPALCIHLARRMKAAIRTARQRYAAEEGGLQFDEDGNPPGLGADRLGEMRENIQHWNQTASRRQGATDYLQKANDALTQLLNQKAEEFQETIAPLQQALVTVQQATQLQQAQNPMNVLPPPGTVNVMPGGDQGPAGMPAPGAEDLGAAAQALAGPMGGGAPGGDPSGAGAPPGGGMPDAASGPPPAAGGGLPPGVDPSQQVQARKRGGQGKGRGAARSRQGLEYTAAGVMDLWNKFQTQRGQSGNLGIGGDADYEAFATQFGIGQQALNKLKQHHQTGVTVGRKKSLPKARGAAAEAPNIAEEAVKNQWRQMDSAMSGHGYKFDKGSNHWTKPGYPPIKNHWQHTGASEEFNKYNHPIDWSRYDTETPSGWDLVGQGGSEPPEEGFSSKPNPGYNDPEFRQNVRAMGKLPGKQGGQHDYDPDNPEQIFAPQRGHGWEHDSGPSGSPYVRPQSDQDYEGHPTPHHHEASDLVDPDKMWNNFHELDSGSGHQNHYTEHPQWSTPHPREAKGQFDGPDSMGYYWDEQGHEHDPDEVKKKPPAGQVKRKPQQKGGSRKEAWMGWGPAMFPKTREVTGWDWDNHLNGYLANRPQHFACNCGDSFPAPTGFHRCACGRQWNSYVIGSGGNNHEASAEKFLVREIPVRPDVIVANRTMSHNEELPYLSESDYPHSREARTQADSLRDVSDYQEQVPAHVSRRSSAASRARNAASEGQSRAGGRVRQKRVLASETAGDRDSGRQVRSVRDDGPDSSQRQSHRRANSGVQQAQSRSLQAGHRRADSWAGSEVHELPASLGVREGGTSTAFRKGAPFADYDDWDDCVDANRGKVDDVDAYCGEIKHRTEDKHGAVDPNWQPPGNWNEHFINDAHEREKAHQQPGYKPYTWDNFDSDMDAQGISSRPKHAMLSLIDPRTGGMHTLIDPGELGEGEDAGTPTFKKQPKDWARRGDGARWQKSPIGA